MSNIIPDVFHFQYQHGFDGRFETGHHSDQFYKEGPFAGWGGKAHVLKPGRTPHVLT